MTGSSGRSTGATKVSKILPSEVLQRVAIAILLCYMLHDSLDLAVQSKLSYKIVKY